MTAENRLVGDRYRLGERIGVGGMGRVWLARDEVLRREVAVKEVLLPEIQSEDEAHELRQRTLREARAAARLAHPNVVRVYDVMYAENRPWIVMEYVPSRSLAQVLKSDGPMRPEEAAVVGLAVLDALCAAHAAGVLHRDVKPGNVLLAEDGRVVLTDFGLATFDEIGSALTQSGIVHGSPQFIAPERALDGTSTVEADMWSLGATLFAAVEGQSPYARSTSYQTLAALATAPPDAPKRAGALKPVLAGLLRRKPTSRMKPDEIRARLLRVANGESGLGLFWSRHQNGHDGKPAGDVRLPPSPTSGSPGGVPARSTSAGTPMTRGAHTAPPLIPSQPTAPSDERDSGPAGSDDGDSGHGARHGSQAERWHRAATNGRDDVPDVDIAVDDAAIARDDAAAASDAYRQRPIEWRNANGHLVRSSSGTKEELETPRRHRRRRTLAAVAAIILVLLAGGGYLVSRQLAGSSKANRQTLPPASGAATGPTAPPGSVAPSGSESSSVRPLAHVNWLCDQQRPDDSVALPITQTTYHGFTTTPSFTWFMFSPDFPIALPGGFQIAYSAATACLYDSTNPARMISINTWTATGAAATDARIAMASYVQLAKRLPDFHSVGGVADADESSTSAQIEYTWFDAAGALHTSARVYLIGKTAYLISWTTSEATAGSDANVYKNMQASVLIGQMPPRPSAKSTKSTK
jgi:eukaryotic-like serine/threonine-protein kinase